MTSRTLVLLALCGTVVACEDNETTDTTTTMPRTFTVRVENIAPFTVLKAGTQKVKTSGMAGPAGSGEAFEVAFTAGKGQSVSFVAMLGESNDWFFAPGPSGIALYDAAGMPVAGDVTAQVGLWDAGTEINQEPAVGPDTGPRQMTPTQGAADNDATVRPVAGSSVLADGMPFSVPAVSQMIKVMVAHQGGQSFTLRIENVSVATTLHTSQGDRAIHVSPLLWVLHTAPNPLFTPGVSDRGQGLEAIAEAGNTDPLALVMAELSGVATPISPVVAVVHASGEPFFSVGQPDRGKGLEQVAEEGNAALLSAAIAGSLVASMPTGTAAAGPALPAQSYQFTVTAKPGDHLSLVTMFGMSNDWFFATQPGGLSLFGADGTPTGGDVTAMISLYDAGTELDQEPGIGPDVGPQQLMPGQGAMDPVHQVREVAGMDYGRPASAHLRVTLTPM